MRQFALLALALIISTSFAGEAPLLDRLTVHATGPVSVTVPIPEPPVNAVYRAEDGSWRALSVEYADGRVSFDVPAETGGSTIVLLRVPEWLDFEDDAAPEIAALSVAGKQVEAQPELDLGHFSQDALRLSLTVTDAVNPIDAGCATFVLDGVPLTDAQASFAPAEGKALSRNVEIALTDLKPAMHTLRIAIPDAAAQAHVAEMKVEFNTAPLVLDGGFEKLKADGKPVHWTLNKWSTNAETEAEVKVVEGGHSGKHCGELTGIAGGLNLLFGQRVYLVEGKTYKVTGFAKSTKSLGYLSLIGDGSQPKQQYDSSPRIPASEDWQPFEWTFTAQPANRHTLYLRNAGVGSVWYDDIVLEEVEEE